MRQEKGTKNENYLDILIGAILCAAFLWLKMQTTKAGGPKSREILYCKGESEEEKPFESTIDFLSEEEMEIYQNEMGTSIEKFFRDAEPLNNLVDTVFSDGLPRHTKCLGDPSYRLTLVVVSPDLVVQIHLYNHTFHLHVRLFFIIVQEKIKVVNFFTSGTA